MEKRMNEHRALSMDRRCMSPVILRYTIYDHLDPSLGPTSDAHWSSQASAYGTLHISTDNKASRNRLIFQFYSPWDSAIKLPFTKSILGKTQKVTDCCYRTSRITRQYRKKCLIIGNEGWQQKSLDSKNKPHQISLNLTDQNRPKVWEII